MLADAMGLGKTFSVLALIARTLEESQDWESGESEHGARRVYPTKHSSRATLVVVSSYCKFRTEEPPHC